MSVINVSAICYIGVQDRGGYRNEVLRYGRSLATAALRLLLVKLTYRFESTHRFVSDVTVGSQEISASGYVRRTLTNKAIVNDPRRQMNAAERLARVGRLSSGCGVSMPSDFCCLVADDVTLPTMAAGQTMGGAVLYRDTGNDASSPVIAYFCFDPNGPWNVSAPVGIASNAGGSLSFDPADNGGIFRIAEPSGSTPAAPTPPPSWPGIPYNPDPSTDASGTPTFTWSASDATSYDVYLGTTNPPPLVSAGQAGASYAPGALTAATYYWRVIARNAFGATDGPVWTLAESYAGPSMPNSPNPSTDGTGAPTLTWAAAGATSYDVYFGTTNPPPLVSSGQAGAAYAAGALSDGTYYWKIVAINAFGSATGPVWTLNESVGSGDETVTVLTTTATGNQDNFNVGALGTLNVLRCNNASLLTIRGLTNNGATPSDGTMVWIESIGAGQVDIANQNTGSTAANRVINNVTASISLAAGSGRALLCYDATTSRWRVLEHEQGAWIDVPYSSGDFTADGGVGAWTVDSGDVTFFRYWLKGRTLSVALELVNTSSTAITATLDAKIPGGFAAAKSVYFAAGSANDNGGSIEGCVAGINGALSKINYRRLGGSNWSVSTNQTNMHTTTTFEVQ